MACESVTLPLSASTAETGRLWEYLAHIWNIGFSEDRVLGHLSSRLFITYFVCNVYQGIWGTVQRGSIDGITVTTTT